MKHDISPLLGRQRLIADGGMGTLLQARGLLPGASPEDWNLTHPEELVAIHRAYLEAGADYIQTNTFGATREKYHGDAPLEKIISAGVSLARQAADGFDDKPRFVALDVGPTGRLLKPAGDFSFDRAYEAFAEEIRIGADAGADFIVIETIADTYELKAAVLAAKETCALPVFATVTIGENGTLLTGGDVDSVAALLEGLRVDALGLNCGLGPDLMLPHIRRLAQITDLPIIAKANAGLPSLENGRTVFPVGPAEFANEAVLLAEAGASVIGGCCGTTPAHLKAVHDAVLSLPIRPKDPRPLPRTVISSATHAVEISLRDTIVIGERINPTGKKRLKQALAEGDTAYVLREAIAETEAGAHVLDINVGVPGLDEPALLQEVVEAVQGVTDLPLQLDTSDPQALARALRYYNGKALINSVNGKEESMEAVFPLAAKYGGVIVALTLDEKGIPPTPEGRLAIARKILEKGAEYGLKPSDFLIDVLCLAISADSTSAETILASLRLVREELGVATILGVSNISFGLPARPLLHSTFYAMALAQGLSAAIINPLSAEMMTVYRGYRALHGSDRNCEGWIGYAQDLTVRRQTATRAPEPVQGPSPSAPSPTPRTTDGSPLSESIRHGLKADAVQAVETLLSHGTPPLAIIDGEIVPALESIGEGFEKGRIFLPQLLMAAEAASEAFGRLREELAATGSATHLRGPIVIATVKGDIHDIGKNIVRALLENYGFKVIDLGRDVPPERIVEATRTNHARLVGLSALMTTTVPNMAETIRQLHEAGLDCKIMVGGAVLTSEYAKKIKADFYAKDAMQSVRIAERIFKGASDNALPSE